MNINEMEEKLKSLKNERKKLDLEISKLEEEIKKKKENRFSNVKTDKNNEKLFEYYITESKNCSHGTFKDYCGALRNMKEMIEKEYGLEFDFEFIHVDDPIVFQKFVSMFENVADFVAENRRRHYDISAAYNNYYQFLLVKRG